MLAMSPLALLTGYNKGKDETEGIEGEASLQGNILEMPYGGEIHNCSFDGVKVVAGGPLQVFGTNFFNNQQGACMEIREGGLVFGSRGASTTRYKDA